VYIRVQFAEAQAFLDRSEGKKTEEKQEQEEQEILKEDHSNSSASSADDGTAKRLSELKLGQEEERDLSSEYVASAGTKFTSKRMNLMFDTEEKDQDGDEDEDEDDDEESDSDADEDSAVNINPEASDVKPQPKFGPSLTTDEGDFFFHMIDKYGKKRDDTSKSSNDDSSSDDGTGDKKDEDEDEDEDGDGKETKSEEDKKSGEESGNKDDDDDEEEYPYAGLRRVNINIVEKEYDEYQKQRQDAFERWRASLHAANRPCGFIPKEEFDVLSQDEDVRNSMWNKPRYKCKRAGYMQHNRRHAKGGRQCRLCGNRKGLIRKYGLNMCRQCFYDNSEALGWRTYK